MWFSIIGLFLGIAFGLFLGVELPEEIVRYMSLGILAAFDTLVGGLRSFLQGIFDDKIFVSGFVFNIILAISLCFLGLQLGVDLYLGAVIVFCLRLFQNFAVIRRTLVGRWPSLFQQIWRNRS
ncbi:MAG: small basic family protein [Bacilli bacterium]